MYYTTFAVSEKVELVNWFNQNSGMTAVTQTDRPKSVRNCCVTKVFWGHFYVVTLIFLIFLWM